MTGDPETLRYMAVCYLVVWGTCLATYTGFGLWGLVRLVRRGGER
jgi:hypothetical protein